jgi:O-antigen/teichoic acid export membrane protein
VSTGKLESGIQPEPTGRGTILGKLFRKQKILTSVFIIIFVTLITRLGGAVRGIVFARVLGPEQFGIFSLATVFQNVALSFCILGIPSSYSRYIPQYEKKRMLKGFVTRTFLLTSIPTAFFVTLFVLIPGRMAQIVFRNPDLSAIITIAAVGLVALTVTRNLESTFIGMRAFMMSSSMQLVEVCLGTALGITLILLVGQNAKIAITSHVINTFIISGIFLATLSWYFRRGQGSDQSEPLDGEAKFYKKVMSFSIWLALVPVCSLIFRYTDRWMINFFLDSSRVGIYTVGANTAGLLYMVGTAASRVLTPNLSKRWEEGQKERVHNILNLALKAAAIGLLIIAVPLVLWKDFLIQFFYGEAYREGSSVVSYLAVFSILNCLDWILITYILVKERPAWGFIRIIIGMILNALLNWTLIPRMGLVGAALASLSSYLVIVALSYLVDVRYGLPMKGSTAVCMASPFLLLVPRPFLLPSVVVLALLFWFTSLFLNENEKQILKDKVKASVLRVVRRRNR